MWPYVLCVVSISTLFSFSLPLCGVTETTLGAVGELSQWLLLAGTSGFAAFALLKRTKSPTSSTTDAEFVGNIPAEWKLIVTSDLAATPRGPKLPPQSIFLPHARLGVGFPRDLAERAEQRAEQRIARC